MERLKELRLENNEVQVDLAAALDLDVQEI